MPGPVVSVITATYNSAHTLVRACTSLRSQTFGNWQHVIVDDGSTDDTPQVLATFTHDSRVTVVRQANAGQGAALNTALDRATGQFIAFLDADDEYLPNHLSTHVAYLETNPAVDLLWGGLEVIVSRPEDAFVPDMDQGAGFIHASECVVMGTIFARRHVFDTCRFVEDRTVWWKDYELVQAARQHFRVERFPLETYRYYRNSGASLVDQAKKTWT
ncbi:MAG: glycosyltransferase family 2 protein [Bryobacterales bacterium]|nr:glycosyltransferase family 2 protein [Bryobacterales bacterium]